MAGKTFDVIPHANHPKVEPRNVTRQNGLTARAAAKAAVRMTRASKGTASAFVVPNGQPTVPVMVCSLMYRTRRGKTPRRGFVHCAPMPSFKQLLKARPKRRRR